MIGKLISSLLTFLLSFGLFTSVGLPEPSIPGVSILFAGDVMLGRSVMSESLRLSDFLYPFRKVAGYTRDADITFVNLENPIISNCPETNSGFTFCTTPEIAMGLKDSGVDVVSLANNHSGNYGKDGLEQTKEYLDQMGILYTEPGKLVTKEINGVVFGFLGFEYVYKGLTQADLDTVKTADSMVDVLIVSPHWGEEYTKNVNKFQQETAKEFVENGADLIIGHHPHWVQNYEEINGIPVYYSLGNFIFDQMWSEETKNGKLVKFEFIDEKLINTQEFSTYISKTGQPEIVSSF